MEAFANLLSLEAGEEERSVEECIHEVQSLGCEIWEELELEPVLAQLLEWMKETKTSRAWLAAKLYCHLVGVNGSEAHRVCDAEYTRCLLQIMRAKSASTKLIGPSRSSRKPVVVMEDSDSDSEGQSKRKRAKRCLSPEDAKDWKLLFLTIVRLEGYLDELEKTEVFIDLACKLESNDALSWLKRQHEQTAPTEYLLHALLRCAVVLLNSNALEPGSANWIYSALHSLAKSQEYFLLAFAQRLCLQCELSTQTQRTKLVEFLQRVVGGGGGGGGGQGSEAKRRMELFICAESFAGHAKAGKRLLACELLPGFVSGSKPSPAVIQALCRRTKDVAAFVRCAAFRSLSQLAHTHHALLVSDPAVLSAALEAAKYDDKPVVRRWAVKILALVRGFDPQVAQCCMDRLKDVSPICRKSALETLGGMLASAQHINGDMVQVFHLGLLPSCADEDASISKHALELCLSLLCLCPDQHLFQYLFATRSGMELQCLRRVLLHAAADNALARELQQRMIQHAMDTLPSEEDDSVNRSAIWSSWLVLTITFDNMLPSERQFSTDFLFTAWQRVRDMLSLSENDKDGGVLEAHCLQQRVCKLLALCAQRLSLDQKNDLGNLLLGDLSDLTRAPALASEMLGTLVVLSEFDEENYVEIISTWSCALKQCCEQYLLSAEREASKVDNALFLLGELALLGKADRPYVAFPEHDPCTTLIQAFCSPDFLEHQPTSRAFALVALGKLCLRDNVLAKRCTVMFVKQLGETTDFVLRCNVLTILADLGKRYTNLVEPFVEEQIATCLGDGNVHVRFRCLQMLADLLAEEYVKMRPRLFYRILACVQDGNGLVAALARETLSLFQVKDAAAFFHLAGSGMVLAMNNQTSFLMGSGAAVLAGVQIRFLAASRVPAYSFMFSKLSEVQRLECANKIRRDVWGALLDGTLGLDRVDVNAQPASSATRIVMDGFVVVEQVRYSGPKHAGAGDEEENDDGGNHAATATASATCKVLDSLERANMANNVLPALVSLYQVSAKEKSSLVGPILDHFGFLLERFKPECASALAPHRDIQALLKMKNKPALTSKRL